MSGVKKWWNTTVGLLSGSFFGPLFGVVLICLRFFLETPRDAPTNILVVLVGVLCGWPGGVYFSPFNKEDAERLSVIGKSAAAFVSGYLLSQSQEVKRTPTLFDIFSLPN